MTKIRKNSVVKIISGKHKGQTGKILSICQKTQKVRVENINLQTKHIKPKQKDEKGNIKQVEGPIHVSNIKINTTNK